MRAYSIPVSVVLLVVVQQLGSVAAKRTKVRLPRTISPKDVRTVYEKVKKLDTNLVVLVDDKISPMVASSMRKAIDDFYEDSQAVNPFIIVCDRVEGQPNQLLQAVVQKIRNNKWWNRDSTNNEVFVLLVLNSTDTSKGAIHFTKNDTLHGKLKGTINSMNSHLGGGDAEAATVTALKGIRSLNLDESIFHTAQGQTEAPLHANARTVAAGTARSENWAESVWVYVASAAIALTTFGSVASRYLEKDALVSKKQRKQNAKRTSKSRTSKSRRKSSTRQLSKSHAFVQNQTLSSKRSKSRKQVAQPRSVTPVVLNQQTKIADKAI